MTPPPVIEAKEEARKAAIDGFWDAVGLLIADDTIGENEVHAAISAYEAAMNETHVWTPRGTVARMYTALHGARHALDVLMGDTDPDEETPSILAMQGIQAAIEEADKLAASQAHDNQQPQQRDKTEDPG
jgi:hypothetical protein